MKHKKGIKAPNDFGDFYLQLVDKYTKGMEK